jgi:hypothetical protein
MKKISLLCPTRERVAMAETYIRSAFTTATYPKRVELLLYVDNDDLELKNYQAMVEKYATKRLKVYVIAGPPISVSQSWTHLAERSTGHYLAMGNDDLVYVTKGWDVRLEEEAAKYPDDIFCMWFNDGLKKETHCTFPIISRKWYNTVGYFSPGIFEFFFNDTWIMKIGEKIDRMHYVDDVIVEHRHFSSPKGYGKDSTTLRNRAGNAAGRNSRDQKIFNETEHLREEAAARLREVMNV